MEQLIGYLLAIITSIFFSIYVLPKKVVKEKTMYYTVFLTLGFFVTSAIFYTFFRITGICKETVSIPVIIILIIRGLFWFLSVYVYSLAIDKIGVSRAVQYQSLKTPFGVILTLFFLQEFLETNVIIITISTILTFLSAIMLTIKKAPDKKIDKMGIVYAIISAILLATTNLLQKWVTNQGIVYSQHIFTAMSSFVFANLYILLKDRSIKNVISIAKKSMVLAILGGCAFYFASFFQALAYKKLPGSIVAIIVQLSAIWSILIGIIVFKEIDFRKHWKRISLGIIITILSITILL